MKIMDIYMKSGNVIRVNCEEMDFQFDNRGITSIEYQNKKPPTLNWIDYNQIEAIVCVSDDEVK